MTESVWDYPRPPRVEPSPKRARVVLAGAVIADTMRAHRVLETSHPPVYYIPLEDVADGALEPVGRPTFCEWKGDASYFVVIGGDGRRVRAAPGHILRRRRRSPRSATRSPSTQPKQNDQPSAC